MKKLLLILLCLPMIGFGQNDFYLGVGMISSFANTSTNNKQFKSNNKSDLGLYYGNNIKINNYFKTTIEVFYLNNKVILAKEGNKKFELHQNLGFGIKPGIYIKKHSISLSGGVLAVYLFDKDVQLGNQLDYFDESFFYGLEYKYDITHKISCNLGLLYTDFEKDSNWTNHTLTNFTVLQLTLHYII